MTCTVSVENHKLCST